MLKFNLRNNHKVDYLFPAFIQAEGVNSEQGHLSTNVINLATLAP